MTDVERLERENKLLKGHNDRMIEALEAAAKRHPWYGPCDGLVEDGGCSECLRIHEGMIARIGELEDKINSDA